MVHHKSISLDLTADIKLGDMVSKNHAALRWTFAGHQRPDHERSCALWSGRPAIHGGSHQSKAWIY